MPDTSKKTISGAICEVLGISDARQKATAMCHLVAAWKDTTLGLGNQPPPDRPSRPDRPLLRPPRKVPRRRVTQSAPGRITLLHAIAHIGLNAVDLALDMASRVFKTQTPVDFYHDWLGVANDEARHFLMLSDWLADLGAAYGDLPAHDVLWQAADASKHDLLARLAIAPLVLEARGLGVTPTMIDQLKSVGDEKTANALGIIMTDEITHVSVGKRWFDYMWGMDHLDPVSTWHSLVKRYFHGDLKPPFNIAARNAARFSAASYGPLATRDDLVASPEKRPDA